MSHPKWPMVPLGEVVRTVQRPIVVEPGTMYRTLGVKWWGEGAYERQTIDGSATAATTLNQVFADDLIINKIWVRNGSVAVVSSEVHGCVGSNEFPTFEFDQSKILPAWMHWYSKTRELWQKCDALSQGTSGKNRIRPEAFLSIEIPRPSLEEQVRLVNKISRLSLLLNETVSLRRESKETVDQICRSILNDTKHGCPTPTPMRELVRLRKPDTVVDPSQEYHFAGVYCFGRGVFTGSHKKGSEFSYSTLTKLRCDEFVYPKLMAWEGAMAVVTEDCDGLFVSPEFPVFVVNAERVFADILDVHFRSPSVWPKLSGASTGTNVRRRRLNPKDFLNYEFPLPSREAQESVLRVRKYTNDVKQLQQSDVELDAMMPSILDRAFKGEL